MAQNPIHPGEHLIEELEALDCVSFEQSRQVLEDPMKVTYDAETDTLTIVFRDVPVAESDEDKPGVILDYDAAGNLVSIEVLDASARVHEPHSVTLATHG
jgi:YD repeat-containing protein